MLTENTRRKSYASIPYLFKIIDTTMRFILWCWQLLMSVFSMHLCMYVGRKSCLIYYFHYVIIPSPIDGAEYNTSDRQFISICTRIKSQFIHATDIGS